MIRAAIYARYSTDLQSDRSIEDQIAECRSYAERNKLTVIETYADRARSGCSAVNRDGWQQLMRDADARKFHVLIVEDVDRISRDEADYHAFRKRLAFLEIRIHTVHGGEISSIEGSLRAMMSAHYLQNLAHKTRRGLAGVVAQGRYPGGRVYGYRPVPGKPGQIEIDEDQAAVVRRVYQEYTAGRTPRDIATSLAKMFRRRAGADGPLLPSMATPNAKTGYCKTRSTLAGSHGTGFGWAAILILAGASRARTRNLLGTNRTCRISRSLIANCSMLRNSERLSVRKAIQHINVARGISYRACSAAARVVGACPSQVKTKADARAFTVRHGGKAAAVRP